MTKRAILIGIDSYSNIKPAPRSFKELSPLYGCVRDVKKVQEILIERWGFRSEDITMLISPLSEDQALSGNTDQATDLSPSYENIVESINSVLSQSHPKDVVYIQFSGYVQTIPTATPHVRKLLSRTEDLALLPVNLLRDGKCLRDVELAALLYRLTANACEVTIVIDGRSTFARVPQLIALHRPEIADDEIRAVSYGPWSAFGQHTWLQNPPPDVPYALFLIEGYFDKAGGPEFRDPNKRAWWLPHTPTSEAA